MINFYLAGGCKNHKKTAVFAESLSIDVRRAAQMIVSIYCWAATETQGDSLDPIPTENIAKAVGYFGNPFCLWHAMLSSGMIYIKPRGVIQRLVRWDDFIGIPMTAGAQDQTGT